MNGCRNCKYCKCYSGDYWTPDEYECTSYELLSTVPEDELDEIMTRVWENGEEWKDDEEPICPAYEEAPTPEDDYWAEYAWKENHYDKDK